MEQTLTFENYLSKVFGRVALGLVVSGITSFLTLYAIYNIDFFYYNFYTIMLVGVFAELGIAFYFGARLQKMSVKTAWICYIGYAVLTGISLTSIILGYGSATCFMAFAYTGIMFICMAIIGKTTKFNIMGLGGLLATGLITSIIISLINTIFIHSSGVDLILNYLGVFIFLGLIAYDTRKLQYYYQSTNGIYEDLEKVSIYGAFDLYLDFINLFLKLVRILSGRKKRN